MLSQDSFDSVHSPAHSIVEEEIEDEDDAMELLGNYIRSLCFNLKTNKTDVCIGIWVMDVMKPGEDKT